MAIQHHFPLSSIDPQKSYSQGFRADATAKNFPALKGMALSLLKLKSSAFRAPHWHPNANELSYCLSGKALMTIFSPGAIHDTFIINAGDIAYVPMGALHYIENIGSDPLEMLVCFDNENPEDLELSTSIKTFPAHILGATFHQKSPFFETLQKSDSRGFIEHEQTVTPTDVDLETNRYKLNLEELNPFIHNAGGTVKISNNFFMPTLEGLAIYSLVLNEKGIREPHWHPNASELNYLMSGKVRIRLLIPDGTVETFEMNPGDISFLPRGYIHHIENIGTEPVRMPIFFSNAAPSDIGISGCLGAYPNALLSSLFGVEADYFNGIPKYQHDLFVLSGAG